MPEVKMLSHRHTHSKVLEQINRICEELKPPKWSAVYCEDEDDYCSAGRLLDVDNQLIARFRWFTDAAQVVELLTWARTFTNLSKALMESLDTVEHAETLDAAQLHARAGLIAARRVLQDVQPAVFSPRSNVEPHHSLNHESAAE